jgi:lipid A 3-O-deacylase
MTTRKILRRWLAATPFVCAAAFAQDEGFMQTQRLNEPRQGLSVSLENDLFGAKGSDRWYTNGVHLAGSFQRGQEPAALRPVLNLGRWLLTAEGCSPGAADKACDVNLTFGGGQNMYTPRHIDLASPQLRDRPWAGWLYGTLGLSQYDDYRHQMWTFKAGAIGPASLAEQAQTWVHRFISHSPRPLGWGNQLRPRLGLQTSYLSTRRYVLAKTVGLHLSWGGTLGNTRTLGRVGVGMNWSPASGEALHHQPGTLDEGDFLVPDFNSVAVGDTVWEALLHTVFYAHVQGSAVFYNAFLQGESFAGRPQIEPIRGVVTTTLGFTIPVGSKGRHKIGLAFKRRSPEFSVRGEVSRDAYQRWGVLTYAVDFDVTGPGR